MTASQVLHPAPPASSSRGFSGVTTLYINLNGACPPSESTPEHVEIWRWEGLEPIAKGDFITITIGARSATARITGRRWGVRDRGHGGHPLRTLELYGVLTRFDGAEESMSPRDVMRVIRMGLEAAGLDPDVISDMIEHPVPGVA